MYFFFCRYQKQNMNDSLYSLQVPLRIHLESEVQMHDVMAFRNWCEAFVRPASMMDGAAMSRAMHHSLRAAMETVLEAHEHWLEAHPEYRECAWNELPCSVGTNPSRTATGRAAHRGGRRRSGLSGMGPLSQCPGLASHQTEGGPGSRPHAPIPVHRLRVSIVPRHTAR